ncbi:hypothetical protein WR25_02852 [Diploscapter pachys]|uniref:Major facilitator superfamily (MFS) profile domain-containing protein n=1 Tax=Diploscapter pachys TaxID=2018661 RepID=A0A2A2KQ24_9BILA|nr:hypothetical protein WR25_02852 [Diploscapter pachys]
MVCEFSRVPVGTELKGAWMYIIITILTLINLLNYTDRFTIAGVLTDIQKYYNIDDTMGGFIQTMFMIFFIICSPICGYLGDRYNRKWVLTVGIAVWLFWLFLLFRGIVGVGEASYAIISPVMIGDMFTDPTRSRVLMVFYFATPFGCGLGFMVGSAMDTLTGHWQWGVRITAIFGVVALILIIFFIREPERGLAERQSGQIATEIVATSYWDDIKYLATNATYVTSTIGYTATVFAVGSLAWWAPTCILYVQAWKNNPNSTYIDDATKNQTNILFGIITCAGGILGVVIGTMGSTLIQAGRGPFKFIKTPRADCIMCALGALIAAPTLIIAMHTMKTNMTIAWISLFICVTAASFNWAIDVNILLSVVIPSRRSSASSWQILLSHLFGDASGPYILGLVRI